MNVLDTQQEIICGVLSSAIAIIIAIVFYFNVKCYVCNVKISK